MMASVIPWRLLPSFLQAFGVSLAIAAVVVSSSAEGAIKHQYLFNEGATADATGRTIIDSISGANGTVIGPATGGGLPTATANALVLPGGASATAPYVDLPNGIASALTNATFEGWYTLNTVTNWGRIFDFGSSAGGEVNAPGGGGEGMDYIFYSPLRGTNSNQQRGGMRNNDPTFGNVVVGAGTVGAAESLADPNIPYVLGSTRHFAVVFNSTGGTGATPASVSVYIDGTLRASANTAIQLGNLNDVNNWLGRSNWTADDNFGGSISEFRIYDTALNAQEVLNSFTVGPSADSLPLTLEVNRTTGEIKLINQTPAIQIVGYTLTSAAGGLVQSSWRSIADNYDTDSGALFDPDNTWREFSAAGSKVDFSEFDFSTGGTAGGSLGSGGTLTSLQLGAPGAWRKSIYEDLVMDVRLADGSAPPVSMRYVGGQPFQRSDLNFDGTINLTDWNLYVAKVGAVFSSMTAAETYPMGDLNGDLVNNRLDFRLFKTDYNVANGAGAFEAMLASVPEPSTFAMLVLVCAGSLITNRSRLSPVPVNRWRVIQAPSGLRGSSPWTLLATVVLVVTLFDAADAAVKHRYGFNEGAIGDASNRTIVDSEGGANGVVLGAGSSATAGQLSLNGGPSATAAYVDLPNGIISDLTDASFEAWYTIGSAQTWSRIFDFGSTEAAATMGELNGPGGGGAGQDFIFYSPVRGPNLFEQRVGFGNQDLLFGGAQAGNAGGGVFSDFDPEFNHALNQQYHAVVVVDADGAGAGQATVALYINGALAPQAPGQNQANPFPVAHQLANLNDVNNWLGRSNWTGDANFGGSFNEFRIYDHALSESEVTNDFLLGPDATPGSSVVSLQINKTNGQVTLVNNLNQPLQIDYYELTSAAGALNPAGWTGIDGNTAPGEGWDKSGASNANSLIELYLPEEGYTFTAMGQLPIGSAFNPAVFGSGNDGDVQFGVVLSSGAFFSGNVTYVASAGIPGDFNNDGKVDAADYVVWRKTNNSPAGYNLWRTNFGRTAGNGTASAAAVPEPAALWSLGCAVVLCAWAARKRRAGGSPMMLHVKKFGASVAILAFTMMFADLAQAGTPDRIYRLGDDTAESPTLGGTPSSPGIGTGALTLDSQFLDNIAFSDASDLSYSGSPGPTYFDAGSGLLARPGAGTGTFGLQFNGTSDLLFGTGTKGALGVPAQGDDVYTAPNGAPGYTNITTRYINAWVRPTGGAGARRDIVNDSGRFSLFINPSNNWAILNGTTTVNSSIPAAVNTWTHVMHRTIGSGGGAVLYVNGLAAAVTNQGYATGNQTGPALDLVIGAGLNRTSNFFQGQLDEVSIGVAGNNTGQTGGRDYGAFNLATDNDYVRQNLMGVNAGDINRDGSVNSTDINTFITNWRRMQQVNNVTVGDLNSRAFGDLNMNGTVDIDDAYMLHSALRAAGGAGLDFSLLGVSVPEPSGALLAVLGFVAFAARRKR